MEIWLTQLLPKQFIVLLGPLSLVLVGYIVEKHYTPRITLFANAIALISYFSRFSILPLWLIIYINLSTILGFYGFISYSIRFPLFELYYKTGRIYSSLITGVILLYGLTYSI